jgi:CRISPR/Cas system CSM-associated protein Csm3 (group 7 of RAMP superfamily)
MRGKPVGHDRWRGDYTGTLDCALTLLTPLHVGSGLFRLANGQVVKEAIRQGEQLIIPGSSLKGVFRSIAEAISRSCVSKTRQYLPSAALKECTDPENLCVCCRLFGGLGYLGRVRFTDTVISADLKCEIHNVPPLWRPQRSGEGRKFYKHGQLATGNEPL